MKCPHCLVAVRVVWEKKHLQSDNDWYWSVYHAACPECERAIIQLIGEPTSGAKPGAEPIVSLVYPKGIARSPLPNSVPERFATDYREAAAVLPDSAKASAAVSRRLLQDLLREAAGVTPGSLDSEIKQLLDAKGLPSWLADDLDAVRTVGNFAAHPIKSTHTGEVVAVEPGEAEWLLDVIEGLFDFYFVEPAKAKERRDALNAKLEEAGKPVLKASEPIEP